MRTTVAFLALSMVAFAQVLSDAQRRADLAWARTGLPLRYPNLFAVTSWADLEHAAAALQRELAMTDTQFVMRLGRLRPEDDFLLTAVNRQDSWLRFALGPLLAHCSVRGAVDWEERVRRDRSTSLPPAVLNENLCVSPELIGWVGGSLLCKPTAKR